MSTELALLIQWKKRFGPWKKDLPRKKKAPGNKYLCREEGFGDSEGLALEMFSQ